MSQNPAFQKLKESTEVAELRVRKGRAQLEAKAISLQKKELSRLYEAATDSTYHPRRGNGFSADSVVSHAGHKLRNYARLKLSISSAPG